MDWFTQQVPVCSGSFAVVQQQQYVSVIRQGSPQNRKRYGVAKLMKEDTLRE
jgi:hypothetical protein